jgi:integration host factor subunit beta
VRGKRQGVRRSGRRLSALTKRQMALHVAARYPRLTQEEAAGIVQVVLDSMAEAMGEGRAIELRDFGVFQPVVRKPRLGRNPRRPLETVVVPARVDIKFKPGKGLKEALARLPAKGRRQ